MYYDGVISKPPMEQVLKHAGVAGMTWKEHKYIKKKDGTYYYPEGSGGGSTYGEYSKNDPDFDEKNYNDKNRLGDTDFFGFTKPDGTVVILEEDMKWTLPKGAKLTPELVKRLEAMDKDIEARRNRGEKVDADMWNAMAKKAIDGDSGSNGGYSERDIENLSNEVVRGKLGNGKERKELLGEYYQMVQDRVNQKLKGAKSSKKSSTKKESKSTDKTKTPSKPELDYEIKKGNNHYKYKVRKKK